ncbi:MBL fold metallo-hydrolase [Paenibacillus sp. PK3_47]|uniref:MBL fold metallo-hydrolase n=1 Tax=Paenibacillus sp. PK3_47 TaxID=2072642 RepID=UPI00201E6824|nr:MBL fold metallo-hydrolase [Paenibacillus sp. PK3_47]UQZ37278.1 MBL fold metallo-hydrolase [Paenibacillus sp. PK3_47]
MKIIELPVQFMYEGQTYYIYPSLIEMNNELTLVDTGYPGFLPLIESAVKEQGYDLGQLKHIVITHYDDDHIGSLYDFKQKYPGVTIIAGEREAGFISGEVKSERLVQAENLLADMPEEQKEFGQSFVDTLKSLRHVPVDRTVRDGDWLLDGAFRIMATPGHTSGHISLHLPELGSVITGDAAYIEDGGTELLVANPQFCLDLQEAAKSLELLKSLQARHYYCYHGGSLHI